MDNEADGIEQPTALLLVDVQQGLDAASWGNRNNPAAEANMALLLEAWRKRAAPVIHVKHNSTEAASPLRPGQAGNAIKPGFEPAPNEPLFEKTVNSAFIGTALEAHLRRERIHALVIVGLTTDHCVSTTVRMASNLGFEVELVGDATATFERTSVQGRQIPASEMHEINLSSLHQEFCRVVSTQDLLAEL